MHKIYCLNWIQESHILGSNDYHPNFLQSKLMFYLSAITECTYRETFYSCVMDMVIDLCVATALLASFPDKSAYVIQKTLFSHMKFRCDSAFCKIFFVLNIDNFVLDYWLLHVNLLWRASPLRENSEENVLRSSSAQRHCIQNLVNKYEQLMCKKKKKETRTSSGIKRRQIGWH